MNRPDFSDYLAHFASDRSLSQNEKDTGVSDEISNLPAKDRLISILEKRVIQAYPLPWTKRAAVCMTECPWSSLLSHADRYSPYGVGFHKARVFAAGGGPAYYVRADHYSKQQWNGDLHTFVTPFWPEYRPPKLKSNEYIAKTVDYSHEREWRVPHAFSFEMEHVEFVIVNSYEDLAQFPRTLKDQIGREKFLIMDVYRQIEKLWPVHNI